MYIEHFGLTRPLLYDGIACDDRIYLGPAQRAVQADLDLALQRADAVAVIEGPAGAGKSTLAAGALREAATRLAIGCLTDPAETAHELLEQILTEFGFSPYRLSRTERYTQWRQYLSEMAATGSRVGIVVEAADRLAPSVLAELERLTSADIRGGAGATVLLTASLPMADLLRNEQLASLSQRCRAVIRMAPLTLAEMHDYLTFRFEAAGGNWDAVAPPDVEARLHAVSGGIFRVIDNVVETCLARAAREMNDRITLDLLDRVAGQLPASMLVADANVDTSDPATGPADSDSMQPTAGSPQEPESPRPIADLASGGSVTEKAPADTAMHREPPGEIESIEAVETPSAPLTPTAAGQAAGPAELPPNPDDIGDPAIPAAPEPERDEGPEPKTPEYGAAPALLSEPVLDADPQGNAALPEAEADGTDPSAASSDSARSTAVTPSDPADRTSEPVFTTPTAPDRGTEPPELDLADSIGVSTDTGIDIPVLDDMVQAGALTDTDEPIDDDVVDALLSLPGATARTGDDSAAGAAATADDDLSDEDRQQIEMLEAFANADALEQISESMAETIFGNEYAERVSAEVKGTADDPAGPQQADEPAEPAEDRPSPHFAAWR